MSSHLENAVRVERPGTFILAEFSKNGHKLGYVQQEHGTNNVHFFGDVKGIGLNARELEFIAEEVRSLQVQVGGGYYPASVWDLREADRDCLKNAVEERNRLRDEVRELKYQISMLKVNEG